MEVVKEHQHICSSANPDVKQIRNRTSETISWLVRFSAVGSFWRAFGVGGGDSYYRWRLRLIPKRICINSMEKLGGSLYNPYNGKVGQQGISYLGVSYLNLYRLQNIIKEAVVKAQVFALRVNLIVGLATSVSKQGCRSEISSIYDRPIPVRDATSWSVLPGLSASQCTATTKVPDDLDRNGYPPWFWPPEYVAFFAC